MNSRSVRSLPVYERETCLIPPLEHKAQPTYKHVTATGYTLVYKCLFCTRPIQRQGWLRRWKHVW